MSAMPNKDDTPARDDQAAGTGTPQDTPEANGDDAYREQQKRRQEEHDREMEELFGDLDDLPEDTVESLQEKRANLLANIEIAEKSLQRAEDDAATLGNRNVALRQTIAEIEAREKADQKTTARALLGDMVPAFDTLGAELTGLSAARAEDPRLEKLAAGFERTIGQLRAVFNKYGLSAPQSNEAAPDAVTPNAGTPAATEAESAQAPAAAKTADAPDTLESLTADCEALSQQVAELAQKLSARQNDNLQLRRNNAEVEKIAERTERRISEEQKFAAVKVIKDVVPVIDTLELGLTTLEKARDQTAHTQTLASSVRTALTQVTDIFNKNGIRQINPMGEAFDATLHEAVTTMAQDGVEPETVINVINKGYTVNGRVVRAAKVVVTPDD